MRITLDPATDYYVRNLSIATTKGEHHHREYVDIPQDNQFARMLDEMAESVLENRQPKTPGEEGLADMRILEAIYRASKSGQMVRLT